MTNHDRIRVRGVEMLSVRAVAETLGVNESRAYKLVQDGDLEVSHEAHGRRYVRCSDVEKYRRRRDHWLRLHGRQVVNA